MRGAGGEAGSDHSLEAAEGLLPSTTEPSPRTAPVSGLEWSTNWHRFLRADIVLPSLWIAGTIVALLSTLHSLRIEEFDGLNNILQIPFALPWFLLPIGTSNHFLDAYMVSLMGLANAGILNRWLRRRRLKQALLISARCDGGE
jgi:hypothetical protein